MSSILASSDPHFDASDADYILYGENTGDAYYGYEGLAVDAADINADGMDDLVIGAAGNDDGGSAAGKVYLILSCNIDSSTNHITNPSADDGLTGWTSSGRARVSTGGGDPHFVLPREGDYLSQDISVPSGAGLVTVSADLRATKIKAIEGYPYVRIGILDSGGGVIDSEILGPGTSISWTRVSTELELDSSAATLRISLRRTSVRRLNAHNRAMFDGVTVSFDCD